MQSNDLKVFTVIQGIMFHRVRKTNDEVARKIAKGVEVHPDMLIMQDRYSYLATEYARMVSRLHVLVHVADRILAASDSKNNGVVMGEASLCKYFSEGLRDALEPFKGGAK